MIDTAIEALKDFIAELERQIEQSEKQITKQEADLSPVIQFIAKKIK